MEGAPHYTRGLTAQSAAAPQVRSLSDSETGRLLKRVIHARPNILNTSETEPVRIFAIDTWI